MSICKNSHLINYLWYSKDRHQLIKLFNMLKFLGISKKRIVPFLKMCSVKNISDFEAMKILKNMLSNVKSIPEDNRNREMNRGRDICMLLEHSHQPKPTTYLDIGSSNCIITAAIGSAVGLSRSKTYAVDIEQWIGRENKVDVAANDNIQFSFITTDESKRQRIPHENNMFDLITVLQALHHFENLETMMSEIQRLSPPGGIVIIREHNANTEYVYALTELEHLIYGILCDKICIKDYIKNHYGSYKSRTQWDFIFESHGFKCIYVWQKNNPTKHYYAVYVNTRVVLK